MLKTFPFLKVSILIIFAAVLLGGCISPKTKNKSATLLKTVDAPQSQLIGEINRFAKVASMRAKIDLKFEDNSFAELGVAEKYKTAPGELVVQRPANIFLKVQIPFINSDIVQMTSNGEKFRVAVLEDGSGGKYRTFVIGTNDADYSLLQKEVQNTDLNGNGKEIKQNVNAFSNLRPQHFTDAVLVRPIDTEKYSYLQSTILQEEVDFEKKKNEPLYWVLRGYYLLDEFRKNEDGSLKLMRRFWFDRVGSIRLARQQILDAKGEIESDIVYGQEGNLTETDNYNNLPLQIILTRPKEKYKVKITYLSPSSVSIGKTYPVKAFELENTWNLPEVDLDKKLEEIKNRTTTTQNTPTPTTNGNTRSQ
ncbi:MAG TPA: hypothetical protein PKE69_15220 [Pyrinomonadaceae bacterium]|nr:hypothetical protein [Pyrinomonadaceae bacterium]